MNHASNDDRTAFDEAFERFTRQPQADASEDEYDQVFAAFRRVRASRDVLPGWIVAEIAGMTQEGTRVPTTYGAAAKSLMQRMKDRAAPKATFMTPDEISAARQSFGLTQAEFADMLDTDVLTVRRIEMSEDTPSHRKPPARVVRLIRAYLSGYRPSDWIGEDA